MTYPQYGNQSDHSSLPMKEWLGTASLVLGLIAVGVSWNVFAGSLGFICSVVGITLGVAGMIRASKGGAVNRTMAIVGTVLSILGVIILIVVWSAVSSPLPH